MYPEYISWQESGGTLKIPNGWFVIEANFDDENPYIVITNNEPDPDGTKELPFPKSLAYFLRTHFCGSKEMHDKLIEDGERNVRNAMKDIIFKEE